LTVRLSLQDRILKNLINSQMAGGKKEQFCIKHLSGPKHENVKCLNWISRQQGFLNPAIFAIITPVLINNYLA